MLGRRRYSREWEYPFTLDVLPANECLRGWIMFKTNDAEQITTARYQAGDGVFVLRWNAA